MTEKQFLSLMKKNGPWVINARNQIRHCTLECKDGTSCCPINVIYYRKSKHKPQSNIWGLCKNATSLKLSSYTRRGIIRAADNLCHSSMLILDESVQKLREKMLKLVG